MNDEFMLDYLLQMGAMRPEEERLKRRQAQVDALREQSMQPLQGQMVSGHYVAPSWTQGVGQLVQAYGARKGQKKLDAAYGAQNAKQGQMIRDLQARIAAKKQAGIPLTEDEQRADSSAWATFGG